MLTLEEPVGYPERLLVSFKVRSSKTSGSVPIRFGYTNRERRMRKMKSPSAGNGSTSYGSSPWITRHSTAGACFLS